MNRREHVGPAKEGHSWLGQPPLLLVFVILVGGCADMVPQNSNFPGNAAFNVQTFAASESVATGTNAFHFLPMDPFMLVFAWGNGLLGYDIIEMDQTGRVGMFKRQEVLEWGLFQTRRTVHWEAAALSLGTEARSRVLASILNSGILSMQSRYTADVHDGTLWIFVLRQDKQEKRIVCDNHFPDRIQEFAQSLKREINAATPRAIAWKCVSPSEIGRRRRALWDSAQPAGPDRR